MKNCKLYWISLTTTMLLASGCDDSSSSQDVPSYPPSTTACNIGTWKCDDNVLSKCIAGKWRKIKTCDDTTQCNEQTVRCDPKGDSNCTDGTWKCNGNALSKCEAGDWILKQTCDANSTCNAKIGKCTQLDQPETKCRNTEHLFAGRCEPDDLNHCGTHTNDCTKISGWKSGNCIDKQCYASKCAAGYHLANLIDANGKKKAICEQDTHEACGSINTQCGADEICAQGVCTNACQAGEVICRGTCINPKTNPSFCGADASCRSFTTCSGAEKCVDGKCVLSECTPYEALCTENGQKICIDIYGNNPNHCGACGSTCANSETTKATGCNQGECTYICNNNMVNCGSDTMPLCLPREQFKSDAMNCGICDNKCKANELCYDGQCLVNSCMDNSCLYNGACINLNDHCGTQCLNCSTANNASSGYCQNGACVITACANGYHLTASATCEIDTATACPNGRATGVVDCNAFEYTESSICEDRQCKAKTCKDNAHIEGNICVPDTLGACGANKTNCSLLPGWRAGKCEAGVCVATACRTGFCLTPYGQCTNAQSNSTCGIDGGACQFCNIKQVCSAGSCVDKQCVGNVCQQKTEAGQEDICKNDDTHCGSNCQDCNTFASNVTAGVCNTQGYCKATACKRGFHLYNNTCEIDDVTHCGSNRDKCDKANAMNYCNDGKCSYTCHSNYHNYMDQCELDSLENCGTHDNKCNDVANAWNSCNGGICSFTCKDNYHNYDDICEADSLEHCGSHGYSCNIENAKNSSCRGGECVFTCNDGYGRYGNSCRPAFISTWRVTSSDQVIEFPDYGGMEIDFGDGNHSSVGANHNNVFHKYSKPGIYTVTVVGPISQWRCSTKSCQESLISILAYGDVTFGRYAFEGVKALESLPANESPKFYDGDATGAFKNAQTIPDISGWDTSSILNMSEMFYGATSFNQNINGWNTSNVTDMSNMFYGATSFNQPLNGWNTTFVWNMSSMFYGATSFNQDINGWNTSNVTDMSGMFEGATSFNQDINGWNTSNVTNMSRMFKGAKSFNRPLNGWDTAFVYNMSSMFYGATSFNQPLNGWNTVSVTVMNHMFHGATRFNQDINGWNTAFVYNMSSMFYGATSFNQNINGWSTSHVTNMSSMFYEATSFNQNINGWNTSRVTNMSEMFYKAKSFDQSLEEWNISKVSKIEDIFHESGITRDNYCKLFKGAYGKYWTKFILDLGKSYICD